MFPFNETNPYSRWESKRLRISIRNITNQLNTKHRRKSASILPQAISARNGVVYIQWQLPQHRDHPSTLPLHSLPAIELNLPTISHVHSFQPATPSEIPQKSFLLFKMRFVSNRKLSFFAIQNIIPPCNFSAIKLVHMEYECVQIGSAASHLFTLHVQLLVQETVLIVGAYFMSAVLTNQISVICHPAPAGRRLRSPTSEMVQWGQCHTPLFYQSKLPVHMKLVLNEIEAYKISTENKLSAHLYSLRSDFKTYESCTIKVTSKRK